MSYVKKTELLDEVAKKKMKLWILMIKSMIILKKFVNEIENHN